MDLELHQMDVKIALLYRELEEEIYMEQPVSFIQKGLRSKGLQIKKIPSMGLSSLLDSGIYDSFKQLLLMDL